MTTINIDTPDYNEAALKIWEAMFGNCVEAKAGTYVADYKKFLELMEGFSGTVRQNTIKEENDEGL